MSDPNLYSSSEQDAEPLPPSKSELKREAERLQKVGEDLVALSAAQLATVEMDEELADAVRLAQKIKNKKEGYRRQLQLIGKLMRQRDISVIIEGLARIVNQHQAANAALHTLEQTREAIISEGDAAIQRLMNEHPHLDRQRLRQLRQKIHKERAAQQAPRAFRELFQYLKEALGE